MKLRKLILHGFKSFADRTEFEFYDGITAIVGPNGCGKSNIVDAVKWVLGEQRPSHIRGREMADVIFSGSDQRKGVGFAEVSLVLDNEAGLLPIDFAEVVVTRRLYRSGESEYLINANRCRLRDIRELLMDSGGGPGALTVMEQGNIDRLLRADPFERRQVFEEAAGIAKYRSRRKETRRKLDRTLENLSRMRDMLGEYETRQRSLKIQAGKARRWKEFTDELKSKQVVGALARYADLSKRRAAVDGELAEIGRLESIARRTLDEAVASGEERRRELDALKDRAAAVEAELAAQVGERRAGEEKQAARIREADDLFARAATAREAAEAAHRRAAGLEDELEKARKAHAVAAGGQAERTRALAAMDALCKEAEQRVAVQDAQLQALDRERAEAFASETRGRNQEVSTQAELRALEARLDRLRSRAQGSGEELSALEQARKDAECACKQAEEILRALESRETAAEHEAQQSRRFGDVVQKSLARLSSEVAALRARRELLAGLLAGGEGLTAGTRALLEAGRAGILKGVRGTVADMVGDAGERAEALDQALGAAAGAVVVKTTAQAVAALSWLADGQRGRARIVALDRLEGADLPERFAGIGGKEGPLLGALLQGTRLVESLEQALAEKRGLRVIALSGEEVEPSGALLGGTGNAGAGLVKRRAELAEAGQALLEAERERDAWVSKAEAAREGAAKWETTLQALRPELREARGKLRDASEHLAARTHAAGARAEEIDLERAERSEVEAQREECVQRLAGARERRLEAEKRRKRLDGEATELRARMQRNVDEREQARAKRNEALVEEARWSEKAGALELRCRTLEEAIEGARGEEQARAAEACTCRERRAACLVEIETLERLGREREKTLEGLARRVEERRRAAAELERDLDQGGARVRELRGIHEQRRAELERHRLKEQELCLRIETLLDRVRRDYGLELGEMELDPAAAGADPEELEREVEALRARIDRLGNVNHAALEQLAEVEEKVDFLKREESDLVAADRKLRETIERIDRVCTERFTETFAQVKENFQIIFRKLFGGGRAELLLEDPENVLESGIEIRVRPPGKELRNLALLSGGERSLTTVALLFSIYQTTPPPFCLLDEVDAALDEANTVRMCEMLKDFALKGQFIVITHARSTMTAAQRLHGVTMPEAGVSRRVSVSFSDIEAGRVVGLN